MESHSKAPESQLKDPEVITLLDEPFQFSGEMEREVMEQEKRAATMEQEKRVMERKKRPRIEREEEEEDGGADGDAINFLDLIGAMWTSAHSVMCNLRLIMAFISRHLALRRGAESIARIREAERIKNVARIITDVWNRKGPLNSFCSGESMVRFVESSATPDERASLAEFDITREASSRWTREYGEYLAHLDTARRSLNDECGGGLDALFASLSENKNETDRFIQYVTKLKNGLQFEARSPGERGTDCELVRLYVYNVKDIISKKKRNWWKHAKLRMQFLSSATDRKKELVRQLIDRTADDLRKVPGMRAESRSVECDDE